MTQQSNQKTHDDDERSSQHDHQERRMLQEEVDGNSKSKKTWSRSNVIRESADKIFPRPVSIDWENVFKIIHWINMMVNTCLWWMTEVLRSSSRGEELWTSTRVFHRLTPASRGLFSSSHLEGKNKTDTTSIIFCHIWINMNQCLNHDAPSVLWLVVSVIESAEQWSWFLDMMMVPTHQWSGWRTTLGQRWTSEVHSCQGRWGWAEPARSHEAPCPRRRAAHWQPPSGSAPRRRALETTRCLRGAERYVLWVNV